uniref:Uncharacterized protein n=1 Tax=Attheya septentrionalis TaxID=420275 RepID=A0A7S2UQT6_9STRA|mmetsp:Transcript_8593/g.15588  ORF Transcript_8593/g.15588 Transcript_8593/m.15588 type:complete len:238 (+) Transcript_8593:179-892(+)
MAVGCYPNGCCQGCCAGLLVFVSLVFGLIATFSCHIIEVDLGNDEGAVDSFGYGLFGREEIASNSNAFECTRYSDTVKDELFDSSWKAAQAMGLLMVIFTICLAVMMLVIICCGISKCFAIILGVVSLLTSVMAVLMLLLFNSDFCDLNNCSIGVSGVLAVCASITLLLATMPLCCFRDAGCCSRIKQKHTDDKDEEKQSHDKKEEDEIKDEEEKPVTEEKKEDFRDESPEIELSEA